MTEPHDTNSERTEVFVLLACSDDADRCEVLGMFSTREKAQVALPGSSWEDYQGGYAADGFQRLRIDVYPLDPPLVQL